MDWLSLVGAEGIKDVPQLLLSNAAVWMPVSLMEVKAKHGAVMIVHFSLRHCGLEVPLRFPSKDSE